MIQKKHLKTLSVVETLKLEVKGLEKDKLMRDLNLEGKDNELIKVHSVIDKLTQEVERNAFIESEHKTANERIKMLEERDLEPTKKLANEIETLKSEIGKVKLQLQTNNVTLANKDKELTIAYGLVDSFKQDIVTLTDKVETLKSLRNLRNFVV